MRRSAVGLGFGKTLRQGGRAASMLLAALITLWRSFSKDFALLAEVDCLLFGAAGDAYSGM